MLKIAIGNVHLDLGAGRRGVDMGPSAIHLAGLKSEVESLGHRVVENFALALTTQEMADPGNPRARFLPEIAQVCRDLADRVEAALEKGWFPVVLGGDHSVAIGTISGMSRFYRKQGKRIGVIWADAHTDVNTPESSPSGNIHGMPLAVLLGEGPPELVKIAGDEPALRPENVCVIGARDVDITERSVVKRLGLRVYTMSELDERGTAVCVREAIDRVSIDRTLLIIAHRLSTVVDCDQIIVLENGKVVGIGTHSELVKSTPLYRDLAKHQQLG
jgi:arginase